MTELLGAICFVVIAILVERYWYHDPDSPYIKRWDERIDWWDEAAQEAKRQRKRVKNCKEWKEDNNA